MQGKIVLRENQDDNEEPFQILAQNFSSPEDIFFDQVVEALQEIIVDPKFQQMQTGFMKKQCHLFQNTEENKIEYMIVFKDYQNQIEKYIQKSLIQMVPGFIMQTFLTLLQNRADQIDEQILEILQSFSEFEIFKGLMLDYKSYYEEQERFKTLTIKSSKIDETKKLTSRNSIFSNSSGGLDFGGNKPLSSLKMTELSSQNKQSKKKCEEQLLLPDLFFTIKPLKKC